MNTQAAVLFIALCAVGLPVAAATHTVNQSGFSFSPADLTIQTGDTVQWVWSSSSHTVTNGTGPTDPNVGALFDAPLASGNTTVSFTFNSDGEFPYFCRPHFGLGMTGSVTVQDGVPVTSQRLAGVRALYR